MRSISWRWAIALIGALILTRGATSQQMPGASLDAAQWSLGSTAPSRPHASSASALVGLWGVEQNLGPLVRGELTVDARGREWRARVGGYDVLVEHNYDRISFRLPGDAGELRAHLTADAKYVAGHWIQSANAVYNNRYASPVVLAQNEKNVWSGQIVPLDERVSLYLSIQTASDGSLTAFIRNPEFNLFRCRTYRVELKGSELTLSQGETELRGNYDAQADNIALPSLDSMPQLVLTRRRDDAAIGFYPRVLPEKAGYVYRQPVQAKDGWPTASLSEVGLKRKPLEELIEQILNANVEENPLPIHSLLIARQGKLALEEYFYGASSDRPHDTRSDGKTWATVLVGVARQHGINIGPDTLVYPLFGRYKPFANWDSRKAKLTLRDLMTMTSGFACNDSDENSPGQEDRMQSQTEQSDWYKYTLDLPMAAEPGSDKAIYCSADINLVGGIVREATGRWLPDLFQQDFAQPLQISEYHLNLMPTGEAYMGGGLYMRPRDLLKLGQLYLNGGIWNGKQVVGRNWVEQSTRRWSTLSDPLGMDHQYGFAWHITLRLLGRHIACGLLAATADSS